MKHPLTRFASLLILGLSTQANADVVYVNGTYHQLTKSDFVQSGNNYTAIIEVVGDNGNRLIFDADGTVSGYGKQTSTRQWRCLLPRGETMPSRCWEPDWEVTWSQDFKYEVELKLTCNGYAVGYDLDNKNALVNGYVSDRYREVKLISNQEATTEGNCNQLKVEVIGRDLFSISAIDIDVLVAEAF